MENWKQFKTTGRFAWHISDHGRIKKVSLITDPKKKNYGREWMVTPTMTGGNERQGGYLAISSNWKDKYIHRIVAKTFIPNPEGKRCINHIDGNKLNNHVDNLEWVTYSENLKHAIKTGLWKPYKLEPEERERRKKLRYEKAIQRKREERRKLMHATWSPYLNLKDLTQNEERYIRLRMENCKVKSMADLMSLSEKEVYNLRFKILKKFKEQTGDYDITKLF